MKKKSFVLCISVVVILMFCCIEVLAARQTSLPVEMERDSYRANDTAIITDFKINSVQHLPEKGINRIKYTLEYNRNILFTLDCYNEQGIHIGTADILYKAYVDVPVATAMIELRPREPEKNTDTYFYCKYVKMYAQNGESKSVNDLLVPFYKKNGWFEAKPVLMYASDGRTLYVENYEVSAYKSVGWFTTKPVLMYAADGRTLYVEEYDVEAYKGVGWFKSQPVMMHTTDGRTMYVESYDVEAYKAVGWFKTEFTTLYDGDGNSISVPDFQVDAYKAVGWFIDPVKIAFFYDGGDEIAEFNLNTIESQELTQYVSQGWMAVYSPEELAYKTIEKSIELAYFHNNSLAVPVVIDVGLQMLTGTEYEDDIYALKTKAMDRERKKANCPISVLSVGEAASKESFLYYDVRFKVALWNTSYKKITAFKTSFDCYDAFGNYVKTVTNSPCNVANLYSGEYVTYTWEDEYFDKYVKTIKNLRITEVVYEDGTKWYR